MMSPLVTTAGSRPGTGRGRLLLALAIAQALTLVTRARAQEACKPEFRVGEYVWYAVQVEPRVATYSDSACTKAGGTGATVHFFVRGSRRLVFCDLELSLPDAMRAELEDARRQLATRLPSTRRGMAGTWGRLVHEYSRQLACAPGFERMSDGASEVPSVWCRRQMTAGELCPRPGSTFSEGACYTTSCPEGAVDLARASRGKVGACARCPVGRIDLKESIAWNDLSASSSTSRGPAMAILCRAPSSEPCPGSEPSVTRPSPRARAARVQALGERTHVRSARP